MTLTNEEQGILSVLAQIVADKLDADAETLRSLFRAIANLSDFARRVADALLGKPSSKEAIEAAKELLEWASQLPVMPGRMLKIASS